MSKARATAREVASDILKREQLGRTGHQPPLFLKQETSSLPLSKVGHWRGGGAVGKAEPRRELDDWRQASVALRATARLT